ncbi:hypothetical protein BT96DRAFT_272179 [Gymnopus androsaceus JB14]|uniref:Uncharacterized protein n=1 Tax=Gymnopus androsaceus JB14 TaxID=1447944 RepID=A0A6A4H398_9AGAR|nr:hypothetical protein BT96DRAFT_272179 [Gymnopus androsaceus JB14]
MPIVKETLEGSGITCKETPQDDSGSGVRKMRVGGYDKRKLAFKGWVEIEHFSYRGMQGSFVVMQRDKGSPLSLRELWKGLLTFTAVAPHVLKK